MNKQKQIIILTLALLASGIICDNLDCTTIESQANCNANSNTCAWTTDLIRNTCSQSVDCSKINDQATCQAKSDKICTWDGFEKGCRLDTSICQLNQSNNSCNTGAGCKEGTKTTCDAVLIDKWGCDGLTIDKCNTKDTPFCTIDYTCIYNTTGKCPDNVIPTEADQKCIGPCHLGTFTCQDACPSKQSSGLCEQTPGCKWDTDGNSCKNTAGTCPQNPKKVSTCTNAGCSVVQNTITCIPPTNNDYSSYCKSNQYCQDQNYCTKTNGNKCISDIYFCDLPGSCGNPAPYKQCLQQVSKTCSTPMTSDTCKSIAAKDDCPKLCLWSDGLTCKNVINKSTCTPLNKNEAKCNTLKDNGCVFTQGGVCTSKTADYSAFSDNLKSIITLLFTILLLFI